MAIVEAKSSYTPEDLLTLPDGDHYELVDGNLVERHMGAVSSWTGGILYHFLQVHCQANNLGWVWPADNGYRCFPDAPGKVRRPDVSFIRRGRLPDEQLPTGYVRIAPDLAVEVLSPNDLAYEVDGKVLEYLRAGVRLVWVVNPESRTVRIHRADGSTGWLLEHAELSGEAVVPGFRCAVRELFPPATRPE
jgi:Uma2 family endonuclease